MLIGTEYYPELIYCHPENCSVEYNECLLSKGQNWAKTQFNEKKVIKSNKLSKIGYNKVK